MITRELTSDQLTELVLGQLWNASAPLQITALENQNHDEWPSPYTNGEYHEWDTGFSGHTFAQHKYYPGDELNQFGDPDQRLHDVVGGFLRADQIFGAVKYEVVIRWLAVQTPSDVENDRYDWRPAAIWIPDSDEGTATVGIYPIAARIEGDQVLFCLALRIAGDALETDNAIQDIELVDHAAYMPLDPNWDLYTLADGGR